MFLQVSDAFKKLEKTLLFSVFSHCYMLVSFVWKMREHSVHAKLPMRRRRRECLHKQRTQKEEEACWPWLSTKGRNAKTALQRTTKSVPFSPQCAFNIESERERERKLVADCVIIIIIALHKLTSSFCRMASSRNDHNSMTMNESDFLCL